MLTRVWRPAPASMALIGVLGLGFGVVVALIGLGVLDSQLPMSLGTQLVYVVVGVVAIVVTYRLTVRQRIVVGDHDLVVVNAFRTTVIALVDLETVHAGQYGVMVIWNRDGVSVQTCASAVQKAAIPEVWRRTPARADLLIEQIRAQCERVQSG